MSGRDGPGPVLVGSALVTEAAPSAPPAFSDDPGEAASADALAGLTMLTVPELAERLGTDVVHARSAIKDGTLLAVRRDGVLVVPERQLDGPEPVKHLVPVLRLLRDAKYSDEEALRWLATPDDSLPGSPFDALHENRATEVKRRAQALGF